MQAHFFDRMDQDEQCPHPDEIMSYFLSMTTKEQRMEMEDHLSRCPGCRMALIHLRSLFAKPMTLRFEQRPNA